MKRFKLYRWFIGGVWIQHKGEIWVHGYWMQIGNLHEYISDETSSGYHRTLCSITAIEDYT